MGYVLKREGLDDALAALSKDYLLYAPVRKVGEGRFTDVDVVRYDFVTSASELELDAKSDYSFKELLTPLSKTLFYFTEDEVHEAGDLGAPGAPAQAADDRPVIVFLRACDLHAVRRLDQMYLGNGPTDTFYARIRDRVRFALIGCTQSFASCFCVDMGANVAPEGWLFSLETSGDGYLCAVADDSVKAAFAGAATAEKDVEPAHVTENEVRVRTPPERADLHLQGPAVGRVHQPLHPLRPVQHRVPHVHVLHHAGRVLHGQRARGRAQARAGKLHDRRLHQRGRRRAVPQDRRRAHALQGAAQGVGLPPALWIQHVRGLRTLR